MWQFVYLLSFNKTQELTLESRILWDSLSWLVVVRCRIRAWLFVSLSVVVFALFTSSGVGHALLPTSATNNAAEMCLLQCQEISHNARELIENCRIKPIWSCHWKQRHNTFTPVRYFTKSAINCKNFFGLFYHYPNCVDDVLQYLTTGEDEEIPDFSFALTVEEQLHGEHVVGWERVELDAQERLLAVVQNGWRDVNLNRAHGNYRSGFCTQN